MMGEGVTLTKGDGKQYKKKGDGVKTYVDGKTDSHTIRKPM